VETRIAHSEEEAVQDAGEIGYPVVLKLYSETVTHKTDVGGVALDLKSEEDVRRAYRRVERSVVDKAGIGDFDGVTVQPMISPENGYELIIGSSIDPQFGPVLLFGSGGQLVEVYKDRSLSLPPLNTTLASRMMEQTKVYEALKGVRGRAPVDLSALEKLLVRFSQLVVEQPRIKEIDINPLLASPQGLLALDARIVLHDPEVEDEDLPRPAIRPYPREYVSRAETKDGAAISVRPIRPEDEPLMVRFHESLSERSVYMRYFHMLGLDRRTAHERLTRICFIDYDREMALVAEKENPETGETEILGVGRLSRNHAFPEEEAEFSLLVSDRFQGQGIGTVLLEKLLDVGRSEGLSRVTADILLDNRAMQHLCRKLGFHLRRDLGEGVVKADLNLYQLA
jgi:acetyltransferase